MVKACRRSGECPYPQRRRCLFAHSAEEVPAALLVGSEAPRDDVLELTAEVRGLRRVVQRLAGTIMWGRASPAATAVAEEIAKDKALTEEVCADVEAVTLVPREQVQQWTSQQSEDFPQLP